MISIRPVLLYANSMRETVHAQPSTSRFEDVDHARVNAPEPRTPCLPAIDSVTDYEKIKRIGKYPIDVLGACWPFAAQVAGVLAERGGGVHNAASCC